MRTLVLIVFNFTSAALFGQELGLRAKIDSVVSIIEGRPGRTISFSKTEKNRNSGSVILSYHCKYKNDQVTYILREFSNKDSSVKQRFYLVGSLLIFSTESITYFYGKDSISWAGAYYFEGERLKDYETLGHGKSELESWNPEREVLSNYSKGKADIAAYTNAKNGG